MQSVDEYSLTIAPKTGADSDSNSFVGKIGVYHLLWLAGFIKGSIRARRIVL